MNDSQLLMGHSGVSYTVVFMQKCEFCDKRVKVIDIMRKRAQMGLYPHGCHVNSSRHTSCDTLVRQRARSTLDGINHWKRKHIPTATQICQHPTATASRKQTRNHDTTTDAPGENV